MAEGINTSLFADSSLQCYYRFNSGALTTDSKGSLTLTGSGSPTDTSGKWGNAVYLDTSAYYSRSTALTSNTESWSINMWVKDHTSGCAFSAKSGGYEWYMGTNATNLFLHTHWTDATDGDYSSSLPAGWDSTKWNMISFTLEQSGGDVLIKGYANKNLIIDQTVNSKGLNALESPYYLGYFHVEGKGGGAGKFDDFMFFKNKILSTTEIEQLYNDNGGSFIFNMI